MNYAYKSDYDAKVLPARIPFRPTHRVTRKDGSSFEVNATPEVIAIWRRLGWTVEAVKQS